MALMRDNQVSTLVWGGVVVVVAVLLYSLGSSGGWFTSKAATAICGNHICEFGENNMNCAIDCAVNQQPTQPTIPVTQAVCGDNVCGVTESASSCPNDCQLSAGLTCPSDATTSFEVNVRDALNETGYNRLAVTVKKIGPDGKLIDTATSSSTASTIMKVPCEKATYKLIAYDDDNSGLDIYPVELSVNAYTVSGGAMAGGRIPVTLDAKLQGTIAITVYDSQGTSTDSNITFAAGETNPYTRIMIRETEDDKAAMNLMCMMNYTTSMIKKIEWSGNSPSGLTTQVTAVPQMYAGDGGYEKAWNMFLNGKPLTLDGDSRTADPDRAYFDITLYAYAGVSPDQNATWRCIDRMQFWEADGVTWANGGVPSAEDTSNANLGIAQTAEGVDNGIIQYLD